MNLTKFLTVSACLILALLLTGCGNEPAKFADVDAQRLLNASQTPEEWLTYGGAYDERDDINVDNSIGSGSVFFAVTTPVGPLQLGIGAADNGQFNYYARIGHLF